MPKWTTRSATRYSPDKRFTQHTDRRGHSEQFTVRIPPQIATQISELVAKRIIDEYQKPSDFIADAIVHHLYRIGTEIDSGEIRKAVSIASLYETAERKRVDRETFENFRRVAAENCRAYYEAGDWQGLGEYVIEMMESIDDLPSEYRDTLSDFLQSHLKNARSGGATV